MPKTSVYLHEKDIEFVITKGSNVSEGIRHCINYTRDAEVFKGELREILGELRLTEANKELPQITKTLILGIMEDD